jgi:flagellar motor switch protein FliN/FliY
MQERDERRGDAMTDARELGGLLDIELDANIRFGAREMSLAELLEVGPGAVIPLDRQVTDPVDLIIGEKVVARGEVVLIQGKFGLRVTEVLSG